jgi:hypothetical protein
MVKELLALQTHFYIKNRGVWVLFQTVFLVEMDLD